MAKNTTDSTRSLSPMVMALVGGVVGAGMALFLSDEKRRQKIADMFTDFKESTEELGTTLRDRGMELRESLATEVRGASDDVAGEVKKAKEKLKDDAQKVVQKVKKEVEG